MKIKVKIIKKTFKLITVVYAYRNRDIKRINTFKCL